MKKILSIILVMVFMITFNNNVYAAELDNVQHDDQAYVLNSFSGNNLESISDFKITENQIEFEHFGRNFLFPIHKLNMDTSDGKNIPDANFYTGISDNLICNVVKYNETYCVQVFDCSESIAKRKLDAFNNFTITYGNNIKNQLKDISSAILKTNIKTQNTQRASGGKLHVYTSGLTVPFLVSGGSAEGWCTATRRESNKYQVSSLKYSITYNWPSDGISLWYDFVNSDPAFQSPAWPSSKLTDVSGTWTIRGGTGAFVSESTVSALVKGVPLMWTLYDVSYMDGTHQ